jgi:hypothetical protein
MAKRNSGRRARSRKRRPAAAPVANREAQGGETAATTRLTDEHGSSAPGPPGKRGSPAPGPPAKRVRPRGASARARAAGIKDPQSLGERPQPPWHPLPLSEILILVGIIGVVVGLSRSTPTTALAGVAAVLLGTAEVSWREHRSGFRAHTLLLALLPTVVFHSVVILLLSAFLDLPRVVNFGLLPVDLALALLLFKLLRARFEDARRERRFAGAR